ncbi:MAG: hypothetical protein KGL39_07975 [Patescibacteria group bacterium]|nr:hypothetical protein [Patescibacteria group bacterium]
MPQSIQIDDVGLVDVMIDGVSATIDAFEVYNKIVELAQKHAKAPVHEYHAAIAALLAELGLGEVSHYAASRFADHLHEVIEDLKKKPKSTPVSLASTGLTPSESPSES